MTEANRPHSRVAETLERRRAKRVRAWLAAAKADLAERLAETKRLFGGRVVAVDIHTHSTHSDGLGTIEQNHEAALNAGLDFVFVTDHRSLMQKRALRKFEGMSWGQEPPAGPHHIGLLHNSRLLKPSRDDFAADFERARRLAPFVWIPHPAGWYPDTAYTQPQIEALWAVGPEFAMEILNGAHKLDRAYDHFDEAAIAAWDRLLCDGRRITPLGGSDAHAPEGIGCVWTACLDAAARPESIIETLQAGRCQASEASLLDLRLDGHPMGSVVRATKERPLTLSYQAVDAAGIQCVRLISRGRVHRTLYPRDEPVVEGTWTVRPAAATYYRLESRAVDDRRTYSAPVYVEMAT